jgi:hypothetical protein
MITSRLPQSWQDLQADVARLLAECGFDVEVEKTLATARGAVEIDVYAEEQVRGRKYTIICECKFWRNRVPQNVIHGFRTVVSDIGANVGYVISLNGFQSGSFAASELTNIQLVTWEQFQEAFEESWFEEYFSPFIADRLDPLLSYTEPLLPRAFAELSDAEKEYYLSLKDKHDAFGWLVMMFTPYSRMLRKEGIPKLPLIDRVKEQPNVMKNIPEAILREHGYREFLDACVAHGDQVIAEFRKALKKDTV